MDFNINCFRFFTITNIGSALFCVFLVISYSSFGQTCSSSNEVNEVLTARENGHIDFTIIGDSQNEQENNAITTGSSCDSFAPVTTTSAVLNIPSGDVIRSAHLYWSGAGSVFRTVSLNGNSITADRCWENNFGSTVMPISGAYADVTALVRSIGEGTYTFNGLNNSSVYTQYRCAQGSEASLLYGGWALVVIFENATTYNSSTIFLYDGFRNFQNSSFSLSVQTNVFDDYDNSHVGLVAWEGDNSNFGGGNVDRFTLNGSSFSNSTGAFTDPGNIFNGTDSFENPADDTFYNGDIDDFDATPMVQALENTEAATFNFHLSSGQDLVILNTLVFRIPNEAPDATIQMPDEVFNGCNDDNNFVVDFRYTNSDEASRNLPADTPISFYLNSVNGPRVGVSSTSTVLQPGESETGSATITIPPNTLGDFTLIAVIDDPNVSPETYGTILELYEENNEFTSTGFIDQNYYDLNLTRNLCEGDELVLGDGTVINSGGAYPFFERTQRGGCDSTGILNVILRQNFERTNPLVTLCEGQSLTKPDGEVLTLEPRLNPYEFTDRLISQYGCDSIVHSSFLVNPNTHSYYEPEICAGDGFTLPDGSEVFETGEYEVRLPGAAQNGCDSIIVNNLKVLDIDYPNAFAPNNNGVNDGFKAILPAICPTLIAEYELSIYNRWGEKVFTTTEVRDAWDGFFNGEKSKKGFYMWHAIYTTTADKTINRQGGVTLIR